jgi:DNA replication protein DnaC
VCSALDVRKRRHHESVGSERLTGALLDRLTHHVSILEMNGDSYRLGQSRARKAKVEAQQ